MDISTLLVLLMNFQGILMCILFVKIFEALDVFKIYKSEVENQLNQRIKSVRSNRGGEYYGRFTE